MEDLLFLQNGSDIRGVATEGVPGEEVTLTYQRTGVIAAAFGRWLSERIGKSTITVAVGRDSRITGEELARCVAQGLADSGAKIYDFGYCSTPAMFMSLLDNSLGCDGSIMITASHLPYNRNGMKFFTSEGGLEKTDIKEVLTMASQTTMLYVPHKTIEADFLSKYCGNLVSFIREQTGEDTPLKGSKIIVDAGNGVGGFFADKVLNPLGANTSGSLYLEPNGLFPNHIPNPELNDVMHAFRQAVLKEHADLGVIFDTDVDRAALVDGNGVEINRNRLIALMAAIVLEDEPGSVIVTDSVTSAGLKEFIESKDGVHHRFKRGYKNVINESKRLNAEGRPSALAIETSGHCALRENHFLDDGAYMIVRILIKFAALRKQGKTLSDLIAGLKEAEVSEESRAKINTEDFSAYGKAVLKDLENFVSNAPGLSLESPNFEGVRVLFDKAAGDGWALLRMSLHDPVMPLNIESNSHEGYQKILSVIRNFLLRYDKLSF
jgi:phosphomannomutase